MKGFVCDECGSENILFREWRNQDGEECSPPRNYLDGCCEDHTYCVDCEEFVNSMDHSEYKPHTKTIPRCNDQENIRRIRAEMELVDKEDV